MTQADIQRVGEQLANPLTTEEQRRACYAELRRFNDSLRLRDTQRRGETVTFSNGRTLAVTAIAAFCRRYSVADFCLLYGLERAEVLERTGMGKAGVL